LSDHIILRYSDYNNISTIEEHKKILNKHGKVYWAWWKKDFEVYPKNIIERKKISDIIWLIDRNNNKYFRAKCTNIYSDNQRMISPNIFFTPPYYSKESFYVWFEFIEIIDSDENTFLKHCHHISGDKTLFLSWEKLIRKKQKNVFFEEIPGSSILHISDLHFGTFSAYNPNKLTEPLLINVIKKELLKYKIGVIVISGDFITKGKNKDFNKAEEFVNCLIEICNVKKKQVLIVPGNHDLCLPKNKKVNPKMQNEYLKYYRAFRKRLLDIDETEDIQYIQGFELETGWKLAFSCFDSTRQVNDLYKDCGYIGKDKFMDLLELLRSRLKIKRKNDKTLQKYFIDEKIINFSVIHHQLKMFMPQMISGEKPEPIGILIDGGIFEKNLIENGMHFLLHGHQHMWYHGSSGVIDDKTGKRINLNIISSGSLGAIIGHGGGYPELFPLNSFNIYTPKNNVLHERVYTFGTTTSIKYKDCYIKYL